ncbi:MAG: MoxR family ATPase [Pseudomonadota bacterium]
MQDIQQLTTDLSSVGYIADHDLGTVLHLSRVLQRPLLLEGDAGVGKTAVAQALADAQQFDLVRLQCYEGLDVSTALYEWNYQKQLMSIRLHDADGISTSALEQKIFSEEYLMPRPLLQAITAEQTVVLLIDEIDRADDEFEAFLLELLADFQITSPELGTITARHKPQVVLTSNATRELSDALRRRCLYHFVDYPDPHKEHEILKKQLPQLNEQLAGAVVAFVQKLRQEHLKKTPGVAETLDWASALMQMKVTDLADALPQIEASLGCLLKTRADLELADDTFLQQLTTSNTSQ